MVNETKIADHLAHHGFQALPIGLQPFTTQVALMRQADTVFATLGSSLAGLIYAPDGVTVISAAPQGFSDRFFYALVQAAGGRYAELCGEITQADARYPRDSHFRLAWPRLSAALANLGEKEVLF